MEIGGLLVPGSVHSLGASPTGSDTPTSFKLRSALPSADPTATGGSTSRGPAHPVALELPAGYLPESPGALLGTGCPSPADVAPGLLTSAATIGARRSFGLDSGNPGHSFLVDTWD